MSVVPSTWPEWIDVCAVDEITPDTGVAVLIGDLQIAVVRVGEGDDQIFAVGNYDPFSHAFVIARGIVGDRGGVPKIASPIFKQSFDLRTGQCLDDPMHRRRREFQAGRELSDAKAPLAL